MKYEFSKGTLAVVPNEIGSSLVYEDEERYIIDEKPYKIMDDSCKYFGSTYEGRKNGSRDLLGAEYKVPIVIEDSNNLIVFPTTSPSSEDCAWISLKRVKKTDSGIILQALNNKYEPQLFTYEEMKTIPVEIIGILKRQQREW